MRTTISLDPDVAAAVEKLRRERSVGLSEAVNTLIRAGLRVEEPRRRFEQKTHPLGLRVDVTNIAEALDLLEGADHR